MVNCSSPISPESEQGLKAIETENFALKAKIKELESVAANDLEHFEEKIVNLQIA